MQSACNQYAIRMQSAYVWFEHMKRKPNEGTEAATAEDEGPPPLPLLPPPPQVPLPPLPLPPLPPLPLLPLPLLPLLPLSERARVDGVEEVPRAAVVRAVAGMPSGTGPSGRAVVGTPGRAG